MTYKTNLIYNLYRNKAYENDNINYRYMSYLDGKHNYIELFIFLDHIILNLQNISYDQ
jgi:hypothetical protein